MKSILKLLMAVLLQLAAPKASAQEFGNFLNVLSSVPKIFNDWISQTGKLAQAQDKEKFIQIGQALYRDIDKMIISKQVLQQKISNGTIRNDYTQELRKYQELLTKFQITLSKAEDLSSKLGMSAIKLSNGLNFDFTSKSLLLDDIISNNASKKQKAMENLAQAITILQNSKQNIDLFIEKIK